MKNRKDDDKHPAIKNVKVENTDFFDMIMDNLINVQERTIARLRFHNKDDREAVDVKYWLQDVKKNGKL